LSSPDAYPGNRKRKKRSFSYRRDKILTPNHWILALKQLTIGLRRIYCKIKNGEIITKRVHIKKIQNLLSEETKLTFQMNYLRIKYKFRKLEFNRKLI